MNETIQDQTIGQTMSEPAQARCLMRVADVSDTGSPSVKRVVLAGAFSTDVPAAQRLQRAGTGWAELTFLTDNQALLAALKPGQSWELSLTQPRPAGTEAAKIEANNPTPAA